MYRDDDARDDRRGTATGRGNDEGKDPDHSIRSVVGTHIISSKGLPKVRARDGILLVRSLGYTKVLPAENLPHIVWCITGPLSFLPLHAAGDYNNPTQVLNNLATSSYTPTLGILNSSTTPSTPFSGIVAIGHQSPIRHLSAVPGAKAELDQVRQAFCGLPCTILEDRDAHTKAVLQAMSDHSWVHIACHASQHPFNPLRSAFHLSDGDLDLEEISREPLPNAEFAFLSACQTATGDSILPDEAMHLAAGLLMAGYPTIVATMWSIGDRYAPLVAERFYKCLLEGGTPDVRRVAVALHKATKHLRDVVGAEDFARWLPYIHIGK
ncbi:hypothetical protein FRC09_006882 [Ceratobasidium sp. 395]|nr:hypothetical protein FRC09_006882 [Ceratobasidium sp. 395]